MALKLRRGSDAQRLEIIPEEGELIYTTDTKSLFVGDGTTIGGNGILPALSGDINLNGNDIIGTGNINIDGTITATGNINLGDGPEDTISAGGVFNTSLVPNAPDTLDLGTFSAPWRNVVAQNVFADTTGSVKSLDGSTVVIDALTNTINIDSINVVDNIVVGGNVSAGSVGAANIIGTILASDETTILVDHANQQFYGELIGSVFGSVSGDVLGSIYSNDSTLVIDGVTGNISTPLLETSQVITSAGEITLRGATPSSVFSNSIVADENFARINLIKSSESDQNGTPGKHGEIIFNTDDPINGRLSVSGIQGAHDGLYIFSGINRTASDYVVMKSGNVGIGTLAPAVELDVVGSAVFSGSVTAAAIKGSIVADDSTIIIDGVTGNIPGYVSIAELQAALNDGIGDYAAFKNYILSL